MSLLLFIVILVIFIFTSTAHALSITMVAPADNMENPVKMTNMTDFPISMKEKDIKLVYKTVFYYGSQKYCYQLTNNKWAYYDRYSKTGGSHGMGHNNNEQIYFASRELCEMELINGGENQWQYSLYETGYAQEMTHDNNNEEEKSAEIVCVKTNNLNNNNNNNTDYVLMIYDNRDNTFNSFSTDPNSKYNVYPSKSLCNMAQLNVRYGFWNEIPDTLEGYLSLFDIVLPDAFISSKGRSYYKRMIKDLGTTKPDDFNEYSIINQAIYVFMMNNPNYYDY